VVEDLQQSWAEDRPLVFYRWIQSLEEVVLLESSEQLAWQEGKQKSIGQADVPD
jgi:hypothetical protein